MWVRARVQLFLNIVARASFFAQMEINHFSAKDGSTAVVVHCACSPFVPLLLCGKGAGAGVGGVGWGAKRRARLERTYVGYMRNKVPKACVLFVFLTF